MNLESLANIGEFIGGIGVILSLIYVALQIRHNTASRCTETYARTLERMSGYRQINFLRPEESSRRSQATALLHSLNALILRSR